MIRMIFFVAACLALLPMTFADAPAQVPVEASGGFVSGADISALTAAESRGAIFRGEDKPEDGLTLMRGAGFACFRLRLCVAPNHQGIVANDLEYTLAAGDSAANNIGLSAPRAENKRAARPARVSRLPVFPRWNAISARVVRDGAAISHLC